MSQFHKLATCTMTSGSTSSAPGPSAAKSKAAKAPRHTLSLKEKYDVIDTSNKNPGIGSRALAAMFSCGNSQIQVILNNNCTNQICLVQAC